MRLPIPLVGSVGALALASTALTGSGTAAALGARPRPGTSC